MTFLNPQKIGRYEIKHELGRGGMATVYLAHDPRFKRDVALKVLPRQFTHDPMFRARFEREAQTIATLEHHAIVPVYDFGEEDEQPFLVMRYMTGGTLNERIFRGAIPLEEIIKIIGRIGSALDFAHSKGIIHRDLKPENILFDQHQNAFLSDFGIVKLAQATTTFTGKGILGTPAYMSPEQARGTVELDGRSDIYTLGVILFEMLSGWQPYRAETPIGLALMHISEPIPPIREINPELASGYEQLINRAMAKNREDRFATAGALTAAVQTVARGEALPDVGTSSVSKTEVLPPTDNERSLVSRWLTAVPRQIFWLIPVLIGLVLLGWSIAGFVSGDEAGTAVPIANVTEAADTPTNTAVATATNENPEAAPSSAQIVAETASPTPTAEPSETPLPATETATPSSTPTATATTLLLRVSQSSVNVRRGPGTSYATITTLAEGDTVRVIAKTSNGLWFNVELDDSTTGWIAGSVTEFLAGTEPDQVPVAATIPALLATNTSVPPANTAVPTQPPAGAPQPPSATNPPSPTDTPVPTAYPVSPTDTPILPPTREPTPTP